MITKILIAGLPLTAYGGMVLFLLILIQVLGGLKIIKIKYDWHKYLGICILVFAFFHGILALLYFLN